MDNLYSISRIPVPKKPEAERYQNLPYEPRFYSDSVERFDLPRTWNLAPGDSAHDVPPSSRLRLPAREKRGATTTQEAQIQHLFARASFGLTVAEAQALAATTPAEAVDLLLEEPPMPEPPGEWVREPFDFQQYQRWSQEEQMAFLQKNFERFQLHRMWQFELMMATAFNLREKMTLFWHGHFTSDIQSAVLAQIMFIQNDTWRKHAMGNFRDFLKAMYKDPCMLLYLNGVQNSAEHPNENFARELLELFTMGVGNYTEDDIKEAARALTGWRFDARSWVSFLYPPEHDYGTKTFLGRTGNFGADDIIDIILEQEVTARFICRKLYEFFVSRELNEDFINELANTFRSNDYEIKPVLRQMFTSEFFYTEDVTASLIKSPIDLTVSNARRLSVQSVNVFFLVFAAAVLDQELFQPPNVAGWPGQRAWISPTTYVLRNTVSEIFVNEDLLRDPNTNEPPVRFDPLEFARSFGLSGAQELLDAMTGHLLRLPVSEQTRDSLLSVLVGTADPNDWSLEYPGADRQVKEFLIQVLRLAEHHLT